MAKVKQLPGRQRVRPVRQLRGRLPEGCAVLCLEVVCLRDKTIHRLHRLHRRKTQDVMCVCSDAMRHCPCGTARRGDYPQITRMGRRETTLLKELGFHWRARRERGDSSYEHSDLSGLCGKRWAFSVES
jgi:hypothetical protein